MKQPKYSLGDKMRHGRGPRLAVVFLVTAVGWAVVCPSGSYARVNPLVIIERQIHKANMLIVLDTSGSMTGVPGGTFSSATEAGVDCKNGVNCKASGIQAACKSSGHICMTDADCQVGHCSLTDAVTCSADSQCPAIASKCSVTGGTCTSDADCEAEVKSTTSTVTVTDTQTTTYTQPSNGTQTLTSTHTSIITQTVTNTHAETSTFTVTDTVTVTVTYGNTKTKTDTDTHTHTDTSTHSATSTSTQTSTDTWTSTSTQTSTAVQTLTSTQTATSTQALVICISGGCSTCSATGLNCDANHPCASYAKCSFGGAACTNPGGNCPAVSYCMKDPTKTCTTDAECPQASSGGNCASGGTPPSGCSTQEECPVKTRCETTDETCQGAEDCPGPSKGRCSDNGDTCVHNNQCNDGATCVYWTNACVGPTNPCTLPHSKCDSIPSSKNDCVAQANTCVAHPNTCVSAGTNTCIAGTSGDTCVESNHGPPGPIRMCAKAMTVCNNSNDCPSGDTCGAATSRMMIAKQAVNSLVSKNWDTVNFGLMTFYQNGYFPYYPPATGGTTTTVTVFEDHDKLVANNCFSVAWGPTPTCTIAGTTLTLQKLQNSLYTVPTGPTTSVPANQNYCGLFCEIKPNIGTGLYAGSYYTHTGATGNANAEASVQSSYTGKNIQISGIDHTYYDALTNYYSGGTPPPFTFTNCEVTKACGPRCGGRWDSALAPFLDTSDNPTVAQSNALALAKSLEPASYGGLMAFWSTPTGCTLENTATPTVYTSAYHYMQTVQEGDISLGISSDPLGCRANYVMLVTDGAANGPGDIDAENNSTCAVEACAAPDPVAAGCTCQSVLAAWHLRHNLKVPVKTFVVGFSGDAAVGTISEIINDNIARAGGTDSGDDGVAPFAYQAQNDTELATALQLAVLSAIKGSYSTAPTSSSAGTQQATTVAEGRYALDSRMDFPQWKGHLFAYDLLTANTPCVNDPTMMCPSIVWDAYTMMRQMDWKSRRIYTWDGTDMIKFQVASDGSITNQDALAALGLGSTPDEAGRAARWALGDPAYGNPAILGAIVNSTPIDIASPGDIPQPGGHQFFLDHQNRPHLVYVGSSDGMLHAFFLETTLFGTTTYPAGSEAFAFVPPEMLSVIRRQYVQGGQRPSPYDHIFGLADSPKAKTLCVSGCSDATTAVWKTLLLQTEGYGGNESFVLDVTSPFVSTGLADPPVRMQWHSDFGLVKSSYDVVLGQTVSLPAFLYNKTDAKDDYRLIFTSGYPVSTGSLTQGRSLITALARDGTIVTQQPLSPNASCTLEYTNLTDVATARDFAKGAEDKLLAGYFGDTHGQLWRARLGSVPDLAMDFGCSHPLHFAPTVVQLDRDSVATSHAHEIYPVQVTNSNLDFDTIALPPSKMVFWKEVATLVDGNVTDVARDPDWNNHTGKIELTVGVDSEICGVTEKDASNHVTCKESMPTTARPTATPLGLLKSDASGFQVFTMWYAPPSDSCNKGHTYFTIHEILAGGSFTQKAGAMVAAEPVTSPVVMHGQILLFGAGGSYDITGLSPSIVTTGRALPPGTPGSGLDEYQRYNWTEIMK